MADSECHAAARRRGPRGALHDGALERRRDRLGAALAEMGYEVTIPEATFYMMVRSPIADERAFADRLAAYDVFVGPGDLFEMPGYFRISLTANDEMVTRALPGFAAARKDVLSASRKGPAR
jgi:aspartate aminotransferase